MIRTRLVSAARTLLPGLTLMTLMTFLSIANALAAQGEPLSMPIWLNEIPGQMAGVSPEEITGGRAKNVSTPMLYAYPLPDARPAPAAVVVCPGGGYGWLSMQREGHAVAKWLNERGVAAFVLKYRMKPYHHPIPLADARQAISEVRRQARGLNIDPDRIGIMGFSAGGHLAATVMTIPGQTKMNRPDFGILAYPVISMDDTSLVHKGSRENLLGPAFTPGEAAKLSANLNVTESCPPALLFHARDDKSVPVGNSIKMNKAMKEAGVESELFLVDKGGHGFALGIPEVNDAMEQWLVAHGLGHPAAEAATPIAAPTSAGPVTVFIAGDSTACNYESKRAPRMGWGQVLNRFFDPARVKIENRAISGRSSKSFLDQGALAKIAGEIKAGDYLFIQFGHNDQKDEDPSRYTNPASTYPQTLMKYIETARAAGAQPVLMTSIVRRKFKNGQLRDTHGEYLTAVRNLAAQQDVPLIDMEQKSRALFGELGDEGSKPYFMHLAPGESPNYPEGRKDNTHLQERGALAMAGLVVEGVRELNLPLAAAVTRQ